VSPAHLLWPGVLALVAAAVAVTFGDGGTPGTFAIYNGETENAGSTFAGGWVGAASSPTASASGNDVNFAWTPGTHGPVTGQQLYGVDNGTNSNCTGAAYALLATVSSATTSTYTDGRGTSSNGGNWFCYKLVSTSATAWTAETTLPALQLGVAATAVSSANTGTRCSFSPVPATGKVDCNDTISITFNQKPVLPAGPIAVCVWSTGSIVVGDTSPTTCISSSATSSVGVLTGGTIGSNAAYRSSAFTLSTSAPWTMTITLGGSNLLPPSISGSLAFAPASTIKSAATANQATICTTAASTCRPSATSGF
jgi:hypothetical protein